MSFSFSSLVSVDNYHLLCSLFLIFKPNFDYCFKSTVHLRLRPMDQNNPRTLFPSTSAVTYWQIELQTGPIDGMSNFVCMYFYWKAFTEPEKWAAVRMCWLYQFYLFLWFFNWILELFQKCGIFVFQLINSAVLQSKNYYHILVLPVLDSVRNISPVCPLETINFYKIVFACLSKLVLYFYQT